MGNKTRILVTGAGGFIGHHLVKRLKADGQAPLPVVDGKLRSARLAPGEETVGVVEVKLPPSSPKASALRIDFSQDGRGPVAATLVL